MRKRALFPIYGIVFIDVLGFTTLIPLLPVLGAKFHASPSLLGAALSTSALFATISSPFWGSFSDRFGRKIALQISQACSLTGYALIALAGNVVMLFVARAISGLGGGNLGVAESYIADMTQPKERERAYAWSSAAFGAGFVVGPVIAGQLLALGIAAPFWAAVAFEAINLALTQHFIASGKHHQAARKDLSHALEDKAIRSLLVRQFLYIFAYTYFFGTFSMYARRVLNLSPKDSSVLLGVAGLVGALVLVFGANRFAKRYGDQNLVQIAFICACVSFLALSFAHTLAIFIPFLIVWSAAGATLRPTLEALTSRKAPEDVRGAILGVVDALNNASMILGPVAGGLVLERSPALVGVLPAACCALAWGLGMGMVGEKQ